MLLAKKGGFVRTPSNPPCVRACKLIAKVRNFAATHDSRGVARIFKVPQKCVGGMAPNFAQKRSYNSILAAYPSLSIFSILIDHLFRISRRSSVFRSKVMHSAHPCDVRMRITTQPLPCLSVHAHIIGSST